MTRKLLWRLVLLISLLPFLYFGTASATFLYRVNTGNRERTSVRLDSFPTPRSGQRLLVFSPHPDDEALGCAGLIQQARRAGATVDVCMLTNGDGFRVAAERQFRELGVTPADYVRFGTIRRRETTTAMETLGVRAGDISFLGYPDGGLMSLWRDNWSVDRPYRSAFTDRVASPYVTTGRSRAVYCGQQFLDDLKAVMRTVRPTGIFVTHPSDDHPDHSAAAAFVVLALRQLHQEGIGWAAKCRVHYYLVHRGDWPAPRGLRPTDDLVPPREMTFADTRWSALTLSSLDVERKLNSIQDYKTQTAVMRQFLLSFARSSEVFGDMAAARVPRMEAGGSIRVDGVPSEWTRQDAAIVDPVNDSLIRDFQGGGDVHTVYACRDSVNLYLLIETFQPIGSRIDLRVDLRYFGDPKRSEAGGSLNLSVRSSQTDNPSCRAVAAGTNLEVAIPLRDIGYARQIAVNVETAVAGIQVDRTGYRFLDL